jgi:hypothetical protein
MRVAIGKSKTLSEKLAKAKWAGVMAEVVRVPA